MNQTADELFGTALAEVGQRPVVVVKPSRKKLAEPQPQPNAYTGPIEFVIYGQPASKANSRQIVTIAGRPQVIKSKEARAYEEAALRQVPPKARLQLAGPMRVTLRIFYETERPDLDESIVLDVLQNRYKTIDHPTEGKKRILLQAGVYINDRQVREKHVFHGIDKLRPRTEVRIESIAPQGGLL